jgi:DNA-binding CsgD family transcriptional regulator
VGGVSLADRRVLTLVGEVMGLLDLDELCLALLQALRAMVPAEWCAINEVPADLPHAISFTDPQVPREMHAAFARYAMQNPLARRFIESADGQAIRFSDLITRQELHRLDLYREVYRPLRTEYQIAFTLPSAGPRILGVALSRERRDFTEAEKGQLNQARPYLIQAYRNALAYTLLARGAGGQILASDLCALGLTARQADVLRGVAMGRSDADVAEALGIGVRTVHKHLEHCYRTLAVDNRSQASRIAWETAREA